MSTEFILFLIIGALTIASALMVVLSRHPVKSVLYLVVTFFLISANYVLLNAQFIAIVNIIVYAGAIMVLFLFVLMLLNLNKESEPRNSKFMMLAATVAGLMLGFVLLVGIYEAVLVVPETVPNAESMGLVKNLGNLLFTKYVLPFEISSILFIAAMVGAVLLAKRDKQTID
jgi:NADH-quinone oxidoreductase subunit J